MDQNKAIYDFSWYLMVTCWKKMHQCIKQCNSAFYIIQFEALNVHALQGLLPQMANCQRSHIKFVSEVLNLHHSKSKDLNHILNHHLYIPKLSLTNLIE